jgi:hypothetical protein
MEVIRVVVNDAQGVLTRVLAELVRRKVDVDKAFFGKEDDKVTIIIGIKKSVLNGKLLHALKNISRRTITAIGTCPLRPIPSASSWARMARTWTGPRRTTNIVYMGPTLRSQSDTE